MNTGKTLIVVSVIAGVFTALAAFVPSTLFESPQAVRVVRVGVLPGVDKVDLNHRFSPLLEHIAQQTGLELDLVVPDTYDELLGRFGRNEVDLAYFGGLTFIRAHTDHKARPLVMRDVDARFTTYFVVKSDGPLSDCINLMCDALAGRVMTFGAMLSTSGHLMPRYFLATEKAIDPETHFAEVRYSGAHDKTIYETRDGDSDIGAVNSEIYKAMHRDGRLKEGDLKIVWETPPYPNYVWAVADRISEARLAQLREAYLMLDSGDPRHREILEGMGARSFIPAAVADFESLRQVSDSLGLSVQE